MGLSTSTLRFAFRSIFITQDSEPEDRAAWHKATPAEQAQAEREVRADLAAIRATTFSGGMLTKAEAGKVAKLAW
jgi:hypothetical protein